MKLLCVLDPFVLFPPPDRGRDAARAFFEHDDARSEHGFKIVLSDYLKHMLLTIPDGTPDINNGIFALLFSYLTGPEFNEIFIELKPAKSKVLFRCSQQSFLPHERFANDNDVSNMYEDLACLLVYLQEIHPQKARYASGGRSGQANTENQLINQADTNHVVPIVRSRFAWRESYRQIRKHPADKLPSHGVGPQRQHPVLTYVPHVKFQEEKDDLSSRALDDSMVKKRKWKGLKGKKQTVGYYDRWGNCWVWNAGANHWDVQVTDQVKNSLVPAIPNKKPDYHLNVQAASERFPGEIIHGFEPLQSSLAAWVLLDED